MFLERYPDSDGRALRNAIGDRLGIEMDNVVCGNGAADLIYRIPMVLKWKSGTDQRETGLIVGPAFSEYEKAIVQAGFMAEYYMTKRDDDFLPSESLLGRIKKKDVSIVFIANPGNPTGALCSHEYLLRLCETCKEEDTFIVVDECFLELTGRGKELTLINCLTDFPNLIVLRSFTKTFAMAGLRLGYAVSSNKEMINRIKDCGQPWPVSATAEIAGLVALKEKEYIRNAVAVLNRERTYLTDELMALGLDVINPSSNYVFFYGPKDLANNLKARGFLIRDCSNYEGLSEGAFRIAVKTREENLKLLEAIRNEI